MYNEAIVSSQNESVGTGTVGYLKKSCRDQTTKSQRQKLVPFLEHFIQNQEHKGFPKKT